MEQFLPKEPLRMKTRQVLAGLGQSPGEVARYLDSLGVRGLRNNSECCAVAEFLSVIVASEPGVRGVRVFRRVAIVTRSNPLLFSVVRLPKSVRTFVLAFDAGAYPNLVRSPRPIRRPQRIEQTYSEEERRAS